MSDCVKKLSEATECIIQIIVDNLPIALIGFIVLFMIIAVYRSSPGQMFGQKLGISRGTGTRNQIEMFNKRVKKKNKKYL